MNLPEIKPYEEQAIDTVVSVINRAKELLGIRQTLKQLAKTREHFSPRAIVHTTNLKCPLVTSGEELIRRAIEKDWKITEILMYTLNYLGGSQDECSQYYYFEVIFSQPSLAYPIPQSTASVFFRIEDKHVEAKENKPAPVMIFRVEGHRLDYDIRHTILPADWLLGVIKIKANLFERIEHLQLF
ncbi:uncharacterized protein LOC123715421 [Pieris brassicae]|uniref:uncharacterized protein LOC123715421 n=1 Tax=Pieris brassicae TaxID=7116 RepID=UPI001E661F4F|nr:uncharacterized protein LOC123715421 [Pieris brassicae]